MVDCCSCVEFVVFGNLLVICRRNGRCWWYVVVVVVVVAHFVGDMLDWIVVVLP